MSTLPSNLVRLFGPGGRRRSRWALALLVAVGAGQPALACPTTGDKFIAWNVTTNSDTAPDAAVMGRVTVVVADVDNSLIPAGPRTPAFAIESSASGALSARVLTTTQAASFGTPANHYAITLLTVAGTTCKSLLLIGNAGHEPHAMVDFTASGAISGVRSLQNDDLGIQLSRFVAAADDVDGDGRDEIILTEQGATRLVLSASASGQYAANAKLSALAVWSSFLSAAQEGNADRAIAHLGANGRATFGKALRELGAKLPGLAANIVSVDAFVRSEKLVSIETIVKLSPTSHRAYSAHMLWEDGAWFIASF